MTPAEFRRIAISLAGVEEREHMGHPDFRVAGKIFATLGYPDGRFGTIMLSPEDQAILVRISEVLREIVVPTNAALDLFDLTAISEELHDFQVDIRASIAPGGSDDSCGSGSTRS
jgi:hypothetical protein